MKRLIQTVLMMLLTVCSMSAQAIARVEYKEFDSKNFAFKRPYLIFTPDDYDTNVNSEYDVIYVFDSQWHSRFGLVHNLMHYGCQLEATPNEDSRQYIVVGVASPLYLPEYNFQRNGNLSRDRLNRNA